MQTLEIMSDDPVYDYDIFMLHGFSASFAVNIELSSKLSNLFKRIILINNIGSGSSIHEIDPKCKTIDDIISFTNFMLDSVFK